MATRNIVPRATGEGSIGTSAKTWGAVYTEDLSVSNAITGDVNGTASGNLPLSGGTMTGAIEYSADLMSNRIGYDYDNRNGAVLSLFNAASPTDTGVFKLIADNGTKRKFLEGKPNGDLRWNGLGVALYKDSGYGYLIISNNENSHGVQICWGAAQNATSAGITVTFPKAFPDDSTVRVVLTSTVNSVAWVTDITTTNFKACSATTAWSRYIVIANY